MEYLCFSITSDTRGWVCESGERRVRGMRVEGREGCVGQEGFVRMEEEGCEVRRKR